jgi:serine-type D-Ala-D-Ala carboxypeptidase/endopeptidase
MGARASEQTLISANSTPMKNSSYLNVLFIVLLLACTTNHSRASAELQPGEFFKHWLALRPIPVPRVGDQTADEAAQQQAFARDWLVNQGGEARIRPRPGMKSDINGHTLKWQSTNSETGVFSAADSAHPMDYAIAYAWTEFAVGERQSALLSVGGHQGVKAWLNGQPVQEHGNRPDVRVDGELVPVELLAGKNRLLLKVQNRLGPSDFSCRLLSGGQAQHFEAFRADMENTRNCTLTDADIKDILRESIDFDKQSVGLVVGIVDEHGPRVVSAGKLDNGTDREVDGDTLFEIGSITKIFTALLLQDMLERGEMKLDDPVQTYLPAAVKLPTWQGKPITLLHLATHTSGLPRDCEGEPYSFLSKCQLAQAPGLKWAYSNLGMGLLGHAIARKVGTDYETLVTERICRPLGMDSTSINLSPEQQARFAAGHIMVGHRTRSVPVPGRETGGNVPSLRGCGGIRSTANDLLKFVSAYSGLTASSLGPLMQKAKALHTLESGEQRPLAWSEWGTVFEHGGGTGDFDSELAFDAGKRRGVVVLSNCGRNLVLIRGFWRCLLAGRSPMPSALAPIDATAIDRYLGQYQTSAHQIWTFRREGQRLMVQAMAKRCDFPNPSVEAYPQSDSVFCNEFAGVQINFLDTAGLRPPRMVLTSCSWPGAVEATRISAQLPVSPEAVRADPAFYDQCAGQYRKTLLFGLIRLGPTLGVSHVSDECGEHLFGSVRGLVGRNSTELLPVGKDTFAPEPGMVVGADLEITFARDPKGRVKRVRVVYNGHTITARRVSDQPLRLMDGKHRQ